MRRIIASVDLGSNSIKIVVGEIRGRKINIIAASDTPSKGIKKGVIVNQNSLIESLKLSFKKTEELIGIKVTKVIVNVPARSANFVIGEGTTTINREDKSILPKDIIRALQGSVYNRIPDDMELVAVAVVAGLLGLVSIYGGSQLLVSGIAHYQASAFIEDWEKKGRDRKSVV